MQRRTDPTIQLGAAYKVAQQVEGFSRVQLVAELNGALVGAAIALVVQTHSS